MSVVEVLFWGIYILREVVDKYIENYNMKKKIGGEVVIKGWVVIGFFFIYV